MFQKSKFKDDPPTAIDFFKATHFSSKTGYSEDAQEAIVSTASCLLLYYDGQKLECEEPNLLFFLC